jgi:hypothetical protein
MSTGKQLQIFQDLHEKFCEYDRENPLVWEKFVEATKILIDRGHKKISAELVVNQIRWFYALQRGKDGFKINNNYKAFYARKWAKAYPEFSNIFAYRKSKWDGFLDT